MRRIITLTVVGLLLIVTGVLASTRFNDVPTDHEYSTEIQWAAQKELFKGYGDGTFRPDEDLTPNQFNKVIDRLFDSQDSWTRGETAAFLHHGWNGVYGEETTTTTIPTTSPSNLLSNIIYQTSTQDGFVILDVFINNPNLVDSTKVSYQLFRDTGHKNGPVRKMYPQPNSGIGWFNARFHYNDSYCNNRVYFYVTDGAGGSYSNAEFSIPCYEAESNEPFRPLTEWGNPYLCNPNRTQTWCVDIPVGRRTGTVEMKWLVTKSNGEVVSKESEWKQQWISEEVIDLGDFVNEYRGVDGVTFVVQYKHYDDTFQIIKSLVNTCKNRDLWYCWNNSLIECYPTTGSATGRYSNCWINI